MLLVFFRVRWLLCLQAHIKFVCSFCLDPILLTCFLNLQIQHLTFLPLTLGVGRVGIVLDSLREERRLDVWISWLIHCAWMACFLACFSWTTAFLIYGIGCLGEGVLHVQLLLNHYSKRFFDLKEKLNMVSN